MGSNSQVHQAGCPPRLADTSDQRIGHAAAPAFASPTAKPEPPKAQRLEALPQHNLNDRVQLNGERPDSVGDNTVVCRHFATEYVASANKQALLHDLGSEDRIAGRFSGRLHGVNEQFDTLMSRQRNMPKNLVSGNKLGVYLEHVANALANQPLMPPDGEGKRKAEANILLCGGGHAMALHVQRQRDTQGKESYSVSFYDPNTTGNHAIHKAERPGDYANMELEAFIGIKAKIYALDDGDGGNLMMSAHSIDARIPPTGARLVGPAAAADPAEGAAALREAMRGGVLDAVRGMSQILKDAPTSRDRMQILTDHDSQGFNGLALAMDRAQPEVVKAYGELVMSAPGLSPSQRREAMRGLTKVGDPMLYAVALGHTAAMDAHVANLRRVGITGKDLVDAIDLPNTLAKAKGFGQEGSAALLSQIWKTALLEEDKKKLFEGASNRGGENALMSGEGRPCSG
jgi:hypothetical protein